MFRNAYAQTGLILDCDHIPVRVLSLAGIFTGKRAGYPNTHLVLGVLRKDLAEAWTEPNPPKFGDATHRVSTKQKAALKSQERPFFNIY